MPGMHNIRSIGIRQRSGSMNPTYGREESLRPYTSKSMPHTSNLDCRLHLNPLWLPILQVNKVIASSLKLPHLTIYCFIPPRLFCVFMFHVVVSELVHMHTFNHFFNFSCYTPSPITCTTTMYSFLDCATCNVQFSSVNQLKMTYVVKTY